MGALALDYSPFVARTIPLPPPAPADTGNMRVGITKRIWLFLCAEGGFWSVSEIRERLAIVGNMAGVVSDMVDYGFIVQKKRRTLDGEQVVEYGVVRKCKVPRGVTWEEIQALRAAA